MSEEAADVAQWVIRGILAVVFVGMGINHFRPKAARLMAKMIPPALRREGALAPLNLVYLTGVCEIAGGIGLIVPLTTPLAAGALVVFLIAVFPANHYVSQHPDRFGSVAIPFWPRYVAQLALILLVVLAAV